MHLILMNMISLNFIKKKKNELLDYSVGMKFYLEHV